MKKVLLTLAVAFGMMASANAQLVIGGGINFGGNVNAASRNGGYGATQLGYVDPTIDNFNLTTKAGTFKFGFAPKVGYIINDKIEVGASLLLEYNLANYYLGVRDVSGTVPGKAKNKKNLKHEDFEWAIRPYARYRFFEYNGFGFWLEGIVSLGTSTEGRNHYYAYGSATEVDDNKTFRDSDAAKKLNDAQKPDGHKYVKFNGDFRIQPVITYTINEHWILESQLSLLSLDLGGSVVKVTDKGFDIEGNEAKITEKTNDFHYGLGIFQGEVITFGVAYKF